MYLFNSVSSCLYISVLPFSQHPFIFISILPCFHGFVFLHFTNSVPLFFWQTPVSFLFADIATPFICASFSRCFWVCVSAPRRVSFSSLFSFIFSALLCSMVPCHSITSCLRFHESSLASLCIRVSRPLYLKTSVLLPLAPNKLHISEQISSNSFALWRFRFSIPWIVHTFLIFNF